MNPRNKTRPCAQCGEPAKNPFCPDCYALIPPDVKKNIRLQFKLGAPRAALHHGFDALEKLRLSGVPVKQRKAAA